MRKWMAVLTADPDVYNDFLAHLDSKRADIMEGFLKPNCDVSARQGAIQTLDELKADLRIAANEEKQRARRPVAAA